MLKHMPSTAVSDDREDEDAEVWEVDVVKGDGAEYAVKVAPDTGKVLGAHRDDDDDDDRDERSALRDARVDAREAALAGAAKGTVTEVGLDDDDDSRALAWNVETTKGEWKVDVRTGKVTQDHDDADDQRGGDDADHDDRDDRDDRDDD
ncbi:hypothetical protein B1C81_08805 [Streptomyces sp. HG99]|nr:hypothetical protein B1C81_08805 [Streptomyces sp. HG99]